MRLTGIITQGASRMGTAEFIKSFKVASSFDGKMYTMYKSPGQSKDKASRVDNAVLFFSFFPPVVKSGIYISLAFLQVFIGNTDNDGTRTNLFDPPIVAQYIRIIPVVCRKACTLRLELVGCELDGN